MGPAWVIRNGPNVYEDTVYINWANPSPDIPPNDGNWTAWGTGVTIPALTVAAESGSTSTLGGWILLLLQ